ncbi:hypothetical protein [Streptomyces sp. NPDC094031]|uniref:hypothetical protein n=1 Tax=Streptomyces sp. NPDC094031 TaxID=3155307 RepID=UPI00331BD771
MSDTAENAADMLNAVSGPREVAGVSVSDNGRRQIIDLFERAGLTEEQAVTIVDLGVLPKSLASAKPTRAVAAQFGHMDPVVRAALATLKPADPRSGGKHGIEVGRAAGRGMVSEAPGATSPPNVGKRSYSVTEEEDSSDALGDLVDALNPFQRWTRSTFSVFRSVVTPSVSEETGEVKVTVTSETHEGVTITTEITKPVDSEIPTVVTQAIDSRTGEALTDPITAKAPNVDTVSAVAFGQLAQGLTEAHEEQKAQESEPASTATRGATAEAAEPVSEPSVPAQREAAPEAPAADDASTVVEARREVPGDTTVPTVPSVPAPVVKENDEAPPVALVS